ncbi:hypothetical protein K438DRAFT_1979880 [Mycena galopus ATCC 62051]|nr:hypothetical protein K438DRAFT_1979880 [Mycena galopus ATCC 62051]
MVLAMSAAAAADFLTEYTVHVITALIAVVATYFVLQGRRTAQVMDKAKGEQKQKDTPQLGLGEGITDTTEKETRGGMGEVVKRKMTSVEKGRKGHEGNEQGADEKEGEEDDDGEWGAEWWEGYIGGWGEEGQLLG